MPGRFASYVWILEVKRSFISYSKGTAIPVEWSEGNLVFGVLAERMGSINITYAKLNVRVIKIKLLRIKEKGKVR
jgi:hypothetical protein